MSPAKILAGIALATIGTVLHATDGPKPPACFVVLTDADHAGISLIGQADYTGDGTWSDKAGRIIGYAIEEDSIIYSTRSCAEHRPPYVRPA